MALTASLATSRPAEAKCVPPGPVFAPRSGSSIPSDPVLYVFRPHDVDRRFHKDVEVTAGGRVVAARVELIESRSDEAVYRVSVTGVPPGQLAVAVDAEVATYTITPGWTAPPRAPVEIVDATYEEYYWTCSRERSIRLALSVPAAAYRVTWSATPAMAGRTLDHDVVVWADGSAAPASLRLGQRNCAGANFDLSAARTVRVSALLPDGSELPAARTLDFADLLGRAQRAFADRELGAAASAMSPATFEARLRAAAERRSTRLIEELIGHRLEEPAPGAPLDAVWYYLLGVMLGLIGMALLASWRQDRRSRPSHPPTPPR